MPSLASWAARFSPTPVSYTHLWLYVEDHCKAIDMVASGGRVGEVYNVGGHNERPRCV